MKQYVILSLFIGLLLLSGCTQEVRCSTEENQQYIQNYKDLRDTLNPWEFANQNITIIGKIYKISGLSYCSNQNCGSRLSASIQLYPDDVDSIVLSEGSTSPTSVGLMLHPNATSSKSAHYDLLKSQECISEGSDVGWDWTCDIEPIIVKATIDTSLRGGIPQKEVVSVEVLETC